MNLAICPCGSGKQYEKCCYKKKGINGEPLFFKGAMSGDAEGNWHPLPNVRFTAIIVGQTIDKYREHAKELVANSKLATQHHKDFINLYGLFFQSYEQLLKSLNSSSGEGVSFQMDTIEIRKHWKDYLFNGRILLDFIGLYCNGALSLNQKIGGLNKKKFNLLVNILSKLGVKDKKFMGIKAKLEPMKTNILTFIDFRNREKSQGDTIVEFPIIDSEHGIIEGGKIALNGNSFNMIKFVNNSYSWIYQLTLILLGV